MNIQDTSPTKSALTKNIRTISVKLAYVVLAHSDAHHFGRLIKRLSDPRVAFFVHIDAKANLSTFEEAARDVPNVYFVKDRVRVVWAAFSQVESTLRAFRAALTETDEACSHFVVISGADYPLASNEAILARFKEYPQHQFVRRFNLLTSGDRRQRQRILGWHFRELADRNTWQRKPIFLLESLFGILPKSVPGRITFASGSNWIAITRKFASYCIESNKIDKSVSRILKTAFASDEIYFHTLLQNSEFVHSAAPMEPYLSVTELGGPWKYGNLHFLNPIKDITSKSEIDIIYRDYPDKLFARKFSTSRSKEVLDYLDRLIDGR